jgi:hypothetical protein
MRPGQRGLCRADAFVVPTQRDALTLL